MRFWRLFPRLALGSIFLSVILLIILGRELTFEIVNKLLSIDLGTLGSLSSGIISIVLIILFCSLGLFLLEIICHLLGLGFALLYKINLINKLFSAIGLSELYEPAPHLSASILLNNKNDFFDYVYLRSVSNPDMKSHIKMVRKITEDAIEHTINFTNKDLMEGIALYGSVTQDRKWLESVRDNINEIYYIQITLITILVSFIEFNLSPLLCIIWMLLTVLILILLIPLLKERKRTYALFLLLSYLDNFSTWDAALVEDRDSV